MQQIYVYFREIRAEKTVAYLCIQWLVMSMWNGSYGIITMLLSVELLEYLRQPKELTRFVAEHRTIIFGSFVWKTILEHTGELSYNRILSVSRQFVRKINMKPWT